MTVGAYEISMRVGPLAMTGHRCSKAKGIYVYSMQGIDYSVLRIYACGYARIYSISYRHIYIYAYRLYTYI